jgi:LPXTG-site transpeptidase (sortase) family protein
MKKTVFALLILLCIGLGIYLSFHYSIFAIPQRTSQVLIGETVTPLPAEQTQKTSVAPSQPTAEQLLQKSDPATMPDILPVEENAEPYKPYNANGILGHLIYDGKSVVVRDDIDADTLEKSPGWVPDSSLPGNSGMSIIFGHRNRKHLKLIEPIEVGDTISFRFVSDNRLVSYEVTDVQIFEKTSDWTLPVTDEDVLVLVTCYPFEYTGNAPGKFQVIARLSKNLTG